MKLVVLDHPDWLRLSQEHKAYPVLRDSPCIKVLLTSPETKNWKPAVLFFSTLVYAGLISGAVLLFVTKWWIGLLVMFFSWFPLRKGAMFSIKQEVLRRATGSPRFYTGAIASGALRFLVREADLEGIQHMVVHQELHALVSTT
jgi:hypothetical protein